MDMKANLGSFAAALKDKDVWVMNVVPEDGPKTLKIVYDRGLIGSVHNWYVSINCCSSGCFGFGFLCSVHLSYRLYIVRDINSFYYSNGSLSSIL